jgi:hypothetical protein
MPDFVTVDIWILVTFGVWIGFLAFLAERARKRQSKKDAQKRRDRRMWG